MRSLKVLSNGRLVGLLSEDNNLWQFSYDAQWAGDPGTFDLSPHLQRARGAIVDGASERPVQWYFDSLLPEEGLRTALAREARIAEADAFGLLAYLGAESAGSLVLQDPGADPVPARGLQVLGDEALSQRIRDLPQVTCSTARPSACRWPGPSTSCSSSTTATGSTSPSARRPRPISSSPTTAAGTPSRAR